MKIKFLLLFIFCIKVSFADVVAINLEPKERKIKLFSGSSNPVLAGQVADILGVKLSDCFVGRFNDGEIKIDIKENISGCNVYLIQSVCPTKGSTINDNMIELLLLTRACKRSSAKSVTVIMPYFGYARQDRAFTQEPISASDMAMFLEKAGVNHVICIDLHCGQIQGFFRDVPTENLSSCSVFTEYFSQKKLKDPVIVSPDAGGVARAKKFREKLAGVGVPSKMAIIVKERFEAGLIERMTLVGDVKGSDVIIIDDICDTAGTLVKAAQELKKYGAEHVYACISHPVFSNPALERISASPIDELVIGDTIPAKDTFSSNIKQISVAKLLAEEIKRSNERFYR